MYLNVGTIPVSGPSPPPEFEGVSSAKRYPNVDGEGYIKSFDSIHHERHGHGGWGEGRRGGWVVRERRVMRHSRSKPLEEDRTGQREGQEETEGVDRRDRQAEGEEEAERRRHAWCEFTALNGFSSDWQFARMNNEQAIN
eukprot:758768-Hanusia_phi.AAC.4